MLSVCSIFGVLRAWLLTTNYIPACNHKTYYVVNFILGNRLYLILNWTSILKETEPDLSGNKLTSSYPGWIKSPHVVTLGILKILDLNSLTILGWGGGISE